MRTETDTDALLTQAAGDCHMIAFRQVVVSPTGSPHDWACDAIDQGGAVLDTGYGATPTAALRALMSRQ